MSEISIGASVKLKIHDLSRGGSGVGRLGKWVIFVPFSAPGDELEVEIVSREKRFLHGKILSVLSPSLDRVEPRCKVFGVCGGCTWQHIPYAIQWRTKVNGVLQALKRAIGSDLSAIPEEFPADEPWSYRNRIQLRAENGKLGFFERGSRALVNISRCEVSQSEINEKIPLVLASPEVRHYVLDESRPLKIELDVEPASRLVRTAINQPHAAFGFRQVNDAQNEKLRSWVKKCFSEMGTLLDLYGGSGNLSVGLLDTMKRIDCVDVSVPENASSLAAHFQFHRSPVLPWLKGRAATKKYEIPRENGPIFAIMDPPREGLGDVGQGILECLEVLRVERIVLVGCDPDSFARDVSRILKSGWAIESVALFDFFPQTPHVESAALFVRPI